MCIYCTKIMIMAEHLVVSLIVDFNGLTAFTK